MPRTLVVRPSVARESTLESQAAIPDEARNAVVLELAQQSLQDWIDFFGSLPPGTRSKEDIDRQIEEDRSSS